MTRKTLGGPPIAHLGHASRRRITLRFSFANADGSDVAAVVLDEHQVADAPRLVGELLRRERLARDERIEDVAGGLGVSVPTVSRFERGESQRFDFDFMRAYATRLALRVRVAIVEEPSYE